MQPYNLTEIAANAEPLMGGRSLKMRVHIFPSDEKESVVTLTSIPRKGDLFRRIVTTDERGSSRTDTREVLSVMWVVPGGNEKPYASLTLGAPR